MGIKVLQTSHGPCWLESDISRSKMSVKWDTSKGKKGGRGGKGRRAGRREGKGRDLCTHDSEQNSAPMLFDATA